MNENTKVGSKTQAQLAALEARQAYMEKEQHSTRKRLEDMKKINWLVVVGTITLAITLMGVVLDAWLAPIQLEIQHIHELIRKLQ